jgi:hypothetical protein
VDFGIEQPLSSIGIILPPEGNVNSAADELEMAAAAAAAPGKPQQAQRSPSSSKLVN